MHTLKIAKYKNLNLPWQLQYSDEELTSAANQAIIKTINAWTKNHGTIEIGDTITVMNQALLNGFIVPELTSSALTYLVGDKSVLPALNEAVGKKQGDIFEIDVDFPADAPVERVQNQKVTFRIEIKEVKNSAPKPITEELIKKATPQYNSLAEMQEDYKKRIAENAVENARDEIYQQILNLIIENSTYEFDETDYKKVLTSFQKQSNALEQVYDISQGFDPESSLKKYYQQCEELTKQTILENLIIQEITKLENISITDEEFTNNKAAFTQTPAEAAQYKQFFPDDADFKKFLLKEKIIESLINWNCFK